MLLTAAQTDALTELVNISFARTAASLSELTGHPVLLKVPSCVMHPIAQLDSQLADFMQGEVATVQQTFTGAISGSGILLLNYESAVELAELVMPGEGWHKRRLDSAACEVLMEIGNILLNGCIGMMGNLLQIQLSFSVPQLQIRALDTLLYSFVIGENELSYALGMSTTFSLRDSLVTGYLMLVLDVASIECLVQAVESWA